MSPRAPLKDAVAAAKAGSSALTADEAAGSKSATETAKYLSRASLDCKTTAQSPKLACKRGDKRTTDLIPYAGWLEKVPWEGLGSFISTLIFARCQTQRDAAASHHIATHGKCLCPMVA